MKNYEFMSDSYGGPPELWCMSHDENLGKCNDMFEAFKLFIDHEEKMHNEPT